MIANTLADEASGVVGRYYAEYYCRRLITLSQRARAIEARIIYKSYTIQTFYTDLLNMKYFCGYNLIP